MRQPAFRKKTQGRQVSTPASLPAPTGGWNTRDNLADMNELYAASTDNWFGETTDIRVRRGFVDHVTGAGAAIETLMPYNSQDSTQTLFAAAGDSFYDVTSAGAIGSAVQGSLSNARWQYDNFTNSAGTSYLTCFNGADSPRYWNGSTWTTITGASSPAITGVTTTDIVNSFVFKRRMYLILNNSLSLYYLPVDSVGGATNRTRLDGYFDRGGYIVAGGSWTLDGGDGIDDKLVVISSEGQIAVFRGTNPSSSSSWALEGVWNVGEPIGRRCLIKKGGDLLILTIAGLFPLSRALISSNDEKAVDESVSLTYNIEQSMRASAEQYKTNYGWSMSYFPGGNQLFLNVPVVEGSGQQQYVMNTTTSSWWRFTGVEANCWAVFNEDLYFGGATTVGKFGAVFADNGEDIRTNMKQAFSYLGQRGRLKQVKAMRPNFLANGIPSVSVAFAIDFGDQSPDTSLSFTPSSSGTWDGGTWDGGTWGGDVSAFNDWQTVGAVGTALSLRMISVTNGLDCRYTSSDILYENGGVIG